MMDSLKMNVAIGTGVWIITRSIRWGIPCLIPRDPQEGSIGHKIKRIYDDFLSSRQWAIAAVRATIGDVYDFLPLGVLITYSYDFQGKFPLKGEYEDFIKLTLVWVLGCRIAWIFGFSAVLYLAHQKSYPNAAALAQRILPWIETTAYADYELLA